MIDQGRIRIPQGDGLGIEIDEEALKEHLFDGNWHNPTILLEGWQALRIGEVCGGLFICFRKKRPSKDPTILEGRC